MSGGATLRATAEPGDTTDDRSEDARFTMIEDIDAGDSTFLVVESLADESGPVH